MEMLPVVDEKDNVVGTASLDEVYGKKLPHRIAHVLIFNKSGEMALQLRSAKKKYCPFHWSTAVGGHVRLGETYEEAARREFEEELGTCVPLEFLARDTFRSPHGMRKELATFRADYDGPFRPDPEEVERVGFFPLKKIGKMISAGEKFHPELLFLLKRHFGFE